MPAPTKGPHRISPRRGPFSISRALRGPRCGGSVGFGRMSQATLHTNAGAIVLELHDEDAPKTVENFRKLAGRRLLRRPGLPPGDPGLHDPGRLPGGHRHAAVPATPSRTSSTTTRSCAGRWRWPTPAPTPTARSSSSSPPARRPGSTASTPSSARSSTAWTSSTRSRRHRDRRLRPAARAADDRARRALRVARLNPLREPTPLG